MAIKTTSVAFGGVGEAAINARRVPNLKLEGEGDLSTTAARVRSASVSVAGTGAVSTAPARVRHASVAYQGEPDLAPTAVRVRSADADVVGEGDLEVAARAILVAYAQHIHRADAEYALQQHADVTLSLERAIEGAVYEEGRERSLGPDDEEAES